MVDDRDRKLLARLEAIGRLSQAQALILVNEAYQDGVVSAAEAESLFEVNRRLTGNDPKWERRFIEAIIDYLTVTIAEPRGWVTTTGADWLIGEITSRCAAPSNTELDLLVMLCRRADGVPRTLSRYALTAVSDAIIAEGLASAWSTERMRQLLFAQASDEGAWVSRFEANTLFRINDAVAFADNDPAWTHLFSRAIANHLLASAHPDPMTAADALARQQWLSDTRRNVATLVLRIFGAMGRGDWFTRISTDPEKAARASAALKASSGDAKDRASGEAITEDEQAWFLKRLGWTETTESTETTASPAETALVSFLNSEIPGFTRSLTASV